VNQIVIHRGRFATNSTAKTDFLHESVPFERVLATCWLISRTTRTHLHDYGCTLKAYRRTLVNELRLYGEMHRFMPALLGGSGAFLTELRLRIMHGCTGGRNTVLGAIRVLLNLMLVKFSLSLLTKPLQIFGLVGLLAFLPGTAICA
jgi:hypothetical protein